MQQQLASADLPPDLDELREVTDHISALEQDKAEVLEQLEGAEAMARQLNRSISAEHLLTYAYVCHADVC